MANRNQEESLLEYDIGEGNANGTLRARPLPSNGYGLGIELERTHPPQNNRISVQTVSSGIATIHEAPEQQAPSSADPLMSPGSSGGFSGSTRFDTSPPNGDSPMSISSKRSISSVHYPKRVDSDTSLLHKSATASLHSQYEEFAASQSCNSLQGIKRGRANWLAATSLILAIYSTIFSGIFVCIAVYGPHYGRRIHTNGVLTAASAAFMTSVFAKTIEMSFITVIVALLGQVLSRRAVSQQNSSGITLAELNMRSWVTQPGTMISRWESVRYAGVTLLGVISVVAAIMAMLYTSAATALVQPQLKFADWSPRAMQGVVRASFSNPGYIEHNCNTPILPGDDPIHRTETCASLEHAAMGYHNYYAYLASWQEYVQNGMVSADPAQRPKGAAFFGDNTTVIAPWLTTTGASQTTTGNGHVINNVSLAMPHTGVVAAARNTKNHIMQPEELDGLGAYDIRASVPSAVVHVLCATVDASDLTPFVQSMWANSSVLTDLYDWPHNLEYNDPRYPFPYLGGTALDDVFGWGEAYGPSKWPPVFPQLPIAYNTLLNDTNGVTTWGRDSIYVLGNANTSSIDSFGVANTEYYMCQLKVSQTPLCSTRYNASGNGATLEAVCEDPSDGLAYFHSNQDSPSGNAALALDWPNIASAWAKSLSLNSGLFDGNASNARLLSQLVLHSPTLNVAKPSTAEALAVLAACTLLESTVDAPFVPFFNYTNGTEPHQAIAGILNSPDGAVQYFNASVRAQQYASGGSASYQKSFHVVLVAVFLMNLCALGYFLRHKEWYTDFSEPPNLFSLAVNSPPSHVLAGCCATGPRGRDYGVEWRLGQEGGHVFIENRVVEEQGGGMRRRTGLGEKLLGFGRGM